MKFDIDINKKYEEITIVIKSPEMNQEVTEIMTKLQIPKQLTISGKVDQKIFVLDPKEIYLFYGQGGKVLADTKDKSYEIKQKLYEIEEGLIGNYF